MLGNIILTLNGPSTPPHEERSGITELGTDAVLGDVGRTSSLGVATAELPRAGDEGSEAALPLPSQGDHHCADGLKTEIEKKDNR